MSERFALVTGGAGGVGSEVCRLLAGGGIRPIVGYRSSAAIAEQVADEAGGITLQMDLADVGSIAEAFASARIADRLRHVECAVLAASPPPALRKIGQVDAREVERHLRASVIGNHVVLQKLLAESFGPQRRGAVVGVLSTAMGADGGAGAPTALFGAYAVAKAALRSLLAAFQVDYPWLRVRSLALGLVDTPMLGAFDPRVLERLRASEPVETAQRAAERIVREAYPDGF